MKKKVKKVKARSLLEGDIIRLPATEEFPSEVGSVDCVERVRGRLFVYVMLEGAVTPADSSEVEMGPDEEVELLGSRLWPHADEEEDDG